MDPEDDLLASDPGAPPVAAPGSRRTNRGFWLVAGAILAISSLLAVAILANRGLKDAVAHAQHSLRTAEAAAGRIRAETGSIGSADAAALEDRERSVTFLEGDVVSGDPDEVSVLANDRGWSAAVAARPEACFYLRVSPAGDVTYGSGTVCTGAAAAGAADSRW
jgi:hypothetical protein